MANNVSRVEAMGLYSAEIPGKSQKPIPHYYGDVVRALFIFGAALMLVSLPFFRLETPISVPASLAVIAVLGLAAGLTNPREMWVAALDAIISLAAVVFFGYFAVAAYAAYSPRSVFFWINQVLALNFLIALYYAAKTVRAMLAK